jgi:chorismate mutase
MSVRGIRGAVQAGENTKEAIAAATESLLLAMVEANGIGPTLIASVFLTSTVDLNADFPAYAVRQLAGWDRVPLLGAQEMAVPNAMSRVIRILLHVNSDRDQADIRHVYLGETAKLRPDLEQG